MPNAFVFDISEQFVYPVSVWACTCAVWCLERLLKIQLANSAETRTHCQVQEEEQEEVREEKRRKLEWNGEKSGGFPVD